MTGSLEAHANGFRYLGPKGEVLDIMYRSELLRKSCCKPDMNALRLYQLGGLCPA